MSTIFTKIINGEIPSYKIAENDEFYAFLDINPLAKGHTLVVPKKETDYFFNLDDSILSNIMVFAKEISKAIEQVVSCKRIGVAIIGLEVPHAHIHLVPLNSIYDIDFKKPKLQLSSEEFEEIAKNIKSKITF
jgi:histidine triad (HIT) family protein